MASIFSDMFTNKTDNANSKRNNDTAWGANWSTGTKDKILAISAFNPYVNMTLNYNKQGQGKVASFSTGNTFANKAIYSGSFGLFGRNTGKDYTVDFQTGQNQELSTTKSEYDTRQSQLVSSNYMDRINVASLQNLKTNSENAVSAKAKFDASARFDTPATPLAISI